MSEKPIIIKTTENDNVGVVANIAGLPSGTALDDGTVLTQNVPIGHKVALQPIPKGKEIVRYGQVIGYAAEAILQGGWVQESLVVLPTPPPLDSIPLVSAPEQHPEPLEGFTFEGYRNSDGSVGTKNIGA